MTINLTPRKCLGFRSPRGFARSLAANPDPLCLNPLRFALESTTASSAMMSSGSSASARAMAMRCRCPPENWCG